MLSIDEASKYFDFDNGRMCVPAAYARAQGGRSKRDYTVDGEGVCYWWLRSPGFYPDYAAYVDYDGSINVIGNMVDLSNGCVRPAMWIDLDS